MLFIYYEEVELKKNLIVLQEGNKDCGAACLLSIIRYYGGDVSLERLVNLTKTDKEGTNFYNLSEVSSNLGLNAKCYKVDSDTKLESISTPFVAQINNKNYMHFVVVYKINETKVLIMDPSIGKMVIDLFEFTNMWTGNIMLFEKIKSLPIYREDKPLNNVIIITILKNKSTIIFLIILSFIFTLLSCISSFYSQLVFDKVIDTTIGNLTILTILFSVLNIIKIVTSYIRNYLTIYLNQKLDISIILNTFTKVILLPFYYYKNKTTGEVLSRISDLFSLKTFISRIIISVFLDITIFIGSFCILYFISRRILFILLILSLVYILIIIIFNYPIKKYTRVLQEDTSGVNSYIVESVSAFESIKGLNIEDNIILNFSKKYTKLLNTSYKKQNIENIMLFIKELITDIGILLTNYLTIRLIINNNLSIGNYMTITLLSSYMITPVKNIIDVISEYHYINNSIIRANNLLEVEEEKVYDKKKLEVKGNITINNLSYSYNNKYDVFDNISFYIKEKDRVLILGSSGSGKSTIMKLLYKYYDVERDKIYINNYDINDYSMSDIRSGITYISQNEILFTSSIRDNIIMDRSVTEEEFLKVCKITHVDEIVKNNILGYDYVLEENGINLSGGQRQRIILARSLIKNSNIVMIDEGLNEIDIKLERKILINIFNEYKNKTFIIVSHRKDNMDLYNRLIKIDNGTLKNYERGDL